VSPVPAPPPIGRDIAWTRRDLAGLVLLCAAGLTALAAAAGAPRTWFDDVPAPSASRVAAARERIDPNTASPASLRRLRGIGEVRARAIVEYRQARGPGAFRTANDLQDVPGIGPMTARRAAADLALPWQQE